jgi:hypothetical protein
MSVAEGSSSKEFAAEELKTLVHLIEQHLHWAKSDENEVLARVNMVIAESLIEAADLVRALCKRLSEE